MLSVLNTHAHPQRHKETFRGDGYVYYLNGTDSVSTMMLSLQGTQMLYICLDSSTICIKNAQIIFSFQKGSIC